MICAFNIKDPTHYQTSVLGPQPSTIRCCPSCRIIAQAVARLAYHLGYDETGDELTELLAEMEERS